jgi:DNA helicase-4
MSPAGSSQKNPSQITKKVHFTTPAAGPVLEAYQGEQREQLSDAVRQYVEPLAEGVQNGTITPGRNGKVSV